MAKYQVRRLREHEEQFLKNLGFKLIANSESAFSHWILSGGSEHPIVLPVPIIDPPADLYKVLKLVGQYEYMKGFRAAKLKVAEDLKAQIDISIFGPPEDQGVAPYA